jgi:cellulose synthase/poly-beta-1,6-N-acetylglucosamine synthase-like glycosyltransferase
MIGKRVLKRLLATPAGSLLTVAFVYIVCPALIISGLALSVHGTLRIADWTVAGAFLVTSVAMGIEAIAASRRSAAPMPPIKPPSLSVVVAAYLPNEQDIIMETLRHILRVVQVPSHRLQVILAYNTPSELDVEEMLRELGRTNQNVMPLKVEGSTSKAENVRAALPHLTGDMTVLLDADHHPAADAPARAWRWLLQGYDIVQGRCIVRNPLDNFQTRMVAIEFEQMYAVAHQGRSMLVDTAIFGGTNGWWRTSTLQAIGMDPRMLTEDIESAVRSIQSGYKLVHDRSVISTELSTMTFKAWWSQRLRWAQGWLQVTMRHQARLFKTPHLTRLQRVYWAYMLTWGGIFPMFAMGAVSLLIADGITGHKLKIITDPFLGFTTIVTLSAMILLNVVTWRVASPQARQVGRRWMVVYVLLTPFYGTLKNAVALTAGLREIASIDEWVVTSRARRPVKATPQI